MSIEKLYGNGIRGKVLKWIPIFLKNRRQRVVVGTEKSAWSQVTSGIPQGSVLRPVLFVIFFNEMPDEIKNCIQMYAGDIKLYTPISTEEDGKMLQFDIEHLEEVVI